MTALKSSGDKVLVAIDHETAFVHVIGRGTFKVSTSLKRFGIVAVESRCSRFVVDLEDCTAMDSTFMGVLAGLAFKMKRTGQGEIHLVNLSARLRSLLTTLGLGNVMRIYLEGSTPPEFLSFLETVSGFDETDQESETRRDRAETMLDAHESLVEVSPENLPKFKDVLAFLRDDLDKEDP
jgi:anti-anti-sigma factor